MAMIFYLSSLSDLPIPSLFHSQDFFLHILEYSVLGYLLSMAFANTGLRRSIGLYAFLFTMLYGASDELHQVFVPLRDPSLLDVSADALGALLGMFVFHSIANPDHNAGPVRREERAETRNTRLEETSILRLKTEFVKTNQLIHIRELRRTIVPQTRQPLRGSPR